MIEHSHEGRRQEKAELAFAAKRDRIGRHGLRVGIDRILHDKVVPSRRAKTAAAGGSREHMPGATSVSYAVFEPFSKGLGGGSSQPSDDGYASGGVPPSNNTAPFAGA